MLFRRQFLDGLRAGKVTLAFRRWRRPSVRAGGTLLTPIGQLQIESVTTASAAQISTAEARRAGYGSREELLAELNRRADGDVYRIELGRLGADPRIALRQLVVADACEIEPLVRRLDRLDANAAGAPWTLRVLQLIKDHPGVRAGDLCEQVGQQKAAFKLNVRKLKALGLTESLEIGYRLSPRGSALLERVRSKRGGERSAQVRRLSNCRD